MADQGFIKAIRSEDGFDLAVHYPEAFRLLYFIAFRASREGNLCTNPPLLPGQAFIGDCVKLGFSRRKYRTALEWLVRLQKVTIKPTSKGTIVTISDSSVWDVNCCQIGQHIDQQPTSNRPATDQQPATIKKGKKERRKEGEEQNIASASPQLAGSESDHHLLIRLYSALYLTKTGKDYSFDGGKDGKAVKTLLSKTKLPPSEIVEVARRGWELSDRYLAGRACTLHGLNDAYSNIVAAMSQKINGKSVDHRETREQIQPKYL